ncbi:hypothetical protein BBO_03688 [Beauveria brongniartii RCEF 3172]|uniref:Uncharacterized protein n=1 Tax=Beauveria brongniartii RCEF 3172 TaxID=1081107 RepID=A0A162LUX3_9HYPO|nr:hypothetical protein BBO_03688 [Beauveria brongniartii RCEF 3172]
MSTNETLAPERAAHSDSMTASDANSTGSSAEKSSPGTAEKRNQEQSPRRIFYFHFGSFLPIWQSRAPPPPSQPVESSSSEVRALQAELRERKEELMALRETNDKIVRKSESLREKLRRAVQYIDDLEYRQFEESSSLRDTIKNYKIKSESSAKIIENLETKCAKQTAQLSKVYSNAVSNWAQDVSRDMPDDVVRSTISSFFQGDFFSWCADMCAPEIDWSKDHDKILDYCNLVNQQHHYRSGPAHLLFDHAAPDGCSSLVLLQAALAKSLVDTFLRNPYFHLDDGTILQNIESTFAKKSLKESISWRVNTVRSLEKTFPFNAEQVEVHLNRFLSTFGFLIETLDKTARDDLANLFTRFSQIALKLWQTPTLIRILDMADMADFPFDMSYHYIECEPAVASALGERLNGRPIGVVIRPCILSKSISDSGEKIPPVVWSKALVWVSGKGDPYDMEEDQVTLIR